MLVFAMIDEQLVTAYMVMLNANVRVQSAKTQVLDLLGCLIFLKGKAAYF